MALRRKIYYALIVALAVGGVVFHKTAVAIAEEFPSVFGINLYVILLGLVYLILTISMIEYFVLYRLRYVDKILSEAKTRKYHCKKQVLDMSSDDEIGSIVRKINEMLSECETKNKELKRSSEMYSSIVSDAPLLVCRFSPDGTITFTNEAYANIFGKQEDELVGKNIFDLIEDAGGKSHAIKRSISLLRPEKQSDACLYDIPIISKSYPTWFMWVNRGFFDEYGRVTEFQTVGLDMYQQTTDGVNSVMSNLLSLVYFVNKDGRLKYASPSNESVLGFKPSEMIGKSIFDFVHNDNHEFLEEQFHKRFSNEEKETAIQKLRIKNNKDQYTWVQAAIDSIVASNGSVDNVAINAKDITEIKDVNSNLANAFNSMQKILDRVNTLEFIINKSPVITFVWKNNDSVDYVSGNVSALGYNKSDFIDKKISFEDIIHPQDKEMVLQHINKDVGEYVELEPIKYRVLKKDGNEQVVTDRTIVVDNGDGTIAYYRGVELLNESPSTRDALSKDLSLKNLHLARE